MTSAWTSAWTSSPCHPARYRQPQLLHKPTTVTTTPTMMRHDPPYWRHVKTTSKFCVAPSRRTKQVCVAPSLAVKQVCVAHDGFVVWWNNWGRRRWAKDGRICHPARYLLNSLVHRLRPQLFHHTTKPSCATMMRHDPPYWRHVRTTSKFCVAPSLAAKQVCVA